MLCLNKDTKRLVSLAQLCVVIEEIDATNCLVILGVTFARLLIFHSTADVMRIDGMWHVARTVYTKF